MVLIVASVLFGVSTSMNSLNILWITVNQMQLIMLIFVTGAYFPDKVKRIMQGLNFAMFSFDFLKPKSISIIRSLFDIFDFEIQNVNLEIFGINSGSSFVNSFSFWL